MPGDSLLFMAGSFAALGSLNIGLLILLLIIAAVLGDNTNYFVGRFLGHKAIKWKLRGRQLVNPKYIEKSEKFYEKYGVKTIILARFVPIVRTFAPFVAGIGTMDYLRFVTFSSIGSVLWATICIGAGVLFGEMEFVQKHFELVVLAVIALSLLPIVVEVLKSRLQKPGAT